MGIAIGHSQPQIKQLKLRVKTRVQLVWRVPIVTRFILVGAGDAKSLVVKAVETRRPGIPVKVGLCD